MLYKILSSLRVMIVLLSLLAIGAAAGTFIENDFGSMAAKKWVYHSLWYQSILLLSAANLLFIMHKTKMYRVKTRALFHASFVVILLGAFVTYVFGVEASMNIREGEKSSILVANHQNIQLPFSLELIDFSLTRYPGSRSPSEFSSDVIVIDEQQNYRSKHTVSMNNTLTYRGYKFFQTSYDTDEKGTLLSVSHDPGVPITYVGYFLLFAGLILNLFDKKSRFGFLMLKLKKMPQSLLLSFALLLLQTPSNANQSEYIQGYFLEHKENSKELAKAFGALIVQDPTGRMKPLDTQNRQVLSKLSGKSSWQGMSANQVMLGMFSRPDMWKQVNIIKVDTPKLRALLGVEPNQKLVKFEDFFDAEGRYKLTKEVEEANKLVPSRRGTFHRDLIKVDERLNITFMSYRGVLLTIFPLPQNAQNKWVDFKSMFALVQNSKLKRSTSKLLDAAYNRQYEACFAYVEDINAYQKTYSAHLIPSQTKLSTELWFSQSDLFFRLCLLYLLFAFVLLVYSISSMFFNKLISKKVQFSFFASALLLFAAHTFGIAMRWYIGGFAPISNTYETMIYIAYSAVLAGIIFFRKSPIGLGASFLMAGIFIFGAYLGEIDPEITNLVPVLKSYWLSIHVSVITASYGFFGVGAVLGMLTLVLFMFRDEKRAFMDSHIYNLTYMNEITLHLGLVLLVIGNFLGAIWANESWGRYWGWDPKETWAYISILVYAIVLHLRLLKPLNLPYLFSVVSILAFSSILMTYFGVNFYLAGMHSYATGDPVPIPLWVYVVGGFVLLLVALSYPKKNLKENS